MGFDTVHTAVPGPNRAPESGIMSSVRILLIGPPGVGKGTQATKLKERFGMAHLASGDIFRSEISNTTELGLLAKSYTEKGQLVPDEVTIEMMAKHLMAPNIQTGGFMLDGFPRTLAQAQALDRLLETMNLKLERVIVMEIDDEAVVERLGGRLSCANCGAVYHKVFNPPKVENTCDKCGNCLFVRPDDQPETIRGRLSVYHSQTAPIIEYYERHCAVQKIDASQSPDAVFQSIVDGLPA